ncbi:hypothetical protein K1719_030120 [Acacia pycnantha]|nr:hypothetical protein K1719_030120 [Acacia pycnantha]
MEKGSATNYNMESAQKIAEFLDSHPRVKKVNYAGLAGHLDVTCTTLRCKKYPSMELWGLFQYLVNQLKKGKGIERLVLQVPVNKVRTYCDLRNVLMKRIFLSAMHFRIKTIYKVSNPPFTSVELDHSDSGREGCTMTTLTINAEPNNWQKTSHHYIASFWFELQALTISGEGVCLSSSSRH